jgi:hypothetical protein
MKAIYRQTNRKREEREKERQREREKAAKKDFCKPNI